MDILHDTGIWLVFSFIIFLGIIIKAGLPALNKMLDGRINQIQKDLETAESLRVEAQEMLAQYQRKQRDAVQEAEKIISTAKANAVQLRETAESELNEMIERKEAQLQERVSRMEQNALNEIQNHAATHSMKAAEQLIIESLDKKVSTKLIEDSISSVDKYVN